MYVVLLQGWGQYKRANRYKLAQKAEGRYKEENEEDISLLHITYPGHLFKCNIRRFIDHYLKGEERKKKLVIS